MERAAEEALGPTELDSEHREPERCDEQARAWEDEHRQAGSEDEEARGCERDPVQRPAAEMALAPHPQPPEQLMLVLHEPQGTGGSLPEPGTNRHESGTDPAQTGHGLLDTLPSGVTPDP